MNDGSRTFLHPDQALPLVLEDLPAPQLERVPLAAALGRVLVERTPALVDQPPFDKSAMDGFAYRGTDEGPFRVVETIAAGVSPSLRLGPGECARIMTGAPIPPGADRVQRVEWTQELPPKDGDSKGSGEVLVRFTKPDDRSNIISRGENQKAGDLLLDPRLLGPQDLAILASSGYAEVTVARRPRVGVLSTGDELVEAGQALRAGGIYDSNGPQLTAQAAAAGAQSYFLGIIKDEPGLLESAIVSALRDHDIVILSGGVSMGDFDHVPMAFAGAGLRTVFHGLALKPGKPLYYGRSEGRSGFGLPGNPVSTFVGFELFVRPQIERRMGLQRSCRILRAMLAGSLSRRESDRVEYLPARFETGSEGTTAVRALGYSGSSMLSVLAAADCLLRMEIGETAIEEGRIVDARLLRT